jgi:hypothetical protein
VEIIKEKPKLRMKDHNIISVKALDTMLWCVLREKKKLAFICEKELIVEDVVENMEGEEINGSGHSKEEHLGALDLPSCVVTSHIERRVSRARAY